MQFYGILLLCVILWPLGLGILTAFFILGSGFTLFFGVKIIFYCLTFFAFVYQNIRLSILEPVTIAIRDNISKSFTLEVPQDPLPDKAIYSWHPHGLYAISPFIHSCFSISSWSKPVSLATHSFITSIPLIGLFLIKNKLIPVNEEVIKRELDRNMSVCLIPGGVRESFETVENKFRLVLKDRKGIFRIAIDKQIPLVPVLVFGENDLFVPIDSEWHRYIQRKIENTLSFQLPIPSWKSIKKWFSLLKKPFDEPVRTVLGDPVFPEKDDTIETLRIRYIEALDSLYKKHRPVEWADEIEYIE